MSKPAHLRPVQCYHCRTTLEVSVRAMTVSCPACHKKLLVEDVTVDGAQSVTNLQTCGKVVVNKNGRVIAKLVEAHGGVEVYGVMEAKVVSGAPVFIGPQAQWKGDCRAPAITVELGARITRGYFEIDPRREAPGLTPLPGALPSSAESTP
jgi:DNA-directed RNA polymerase subunit RPC12/RpoP